MDTNSNNPDPHPAAPDEPTVEPAIDQKIVRFLGDGLVAALTTQGDVYVALPGMCAALGLEPRGQLQRIRRHEVLDRGLRRIPLDTPGGRQLTFCLRVDLIGLWLAGATTKTLKPAFRDKVLRYQEQLAPVATRMFLQIVGGITPPAAVVTDPRLVELSEQYQTVLDVAQLIREHMEAVRAATGAIADVGQRITAMGETLAAMTNQQQLLAARQEVTDARVDQIDTRTQQLSPAHKRQVREMVEQIVRATKPLPAPLNYGQIYGRLKYRFQVASYAEIADEAFESVMAYLREMLRTATSGQALQQDTLF